MDQQDERDITPEGIVNPIERNIIGAMIVDKKFQNWCFKKQITGDCFEDATAKLILNAIQKLKNAGKSVEFGTIFQANGQDNPIPISCIINAVSEVNVKAAYTETEIRLNEHGISTPAYSIEENIKKHKMRLQYAVDFDNNVEFAYFCERFKMWVDNEKIKDSLDRLADPDTSPYQRQFSAGVLFAVKTFEAIFGKERRTASGESMGINLYDLINQYDSWKEGNPASLPSGSLLEESSSNFHFNPFDTKNDPFDNEVPF